MTFIKHGDAELINVIEPADVSDEATKEKLESLKAAVTTQESMDLILSQIDVEVK